MKKRATGRRFDPGKYGMIYCPVCKGSGKSFGGVEGGVVCKTCGGFGLIKGDKENNFDDHRIIQNPTRMTQR